MKRKGVNKTEGVYYMLVERSETGPHYVRRWDGPPFRFRDRITADLICAHLRRSGRRVEVVSLDASAEQERPI